MFAWSLSYSKVSGGAVQNPEYDRLYALQAKESNSEKRKQILQQFAELEAENVETVPLFWCHTPFAVGPRIKSWKPGVGSPYHLRLQTVELAR